MQDVLSAKSGDGATTSENTYNKLGRSMSAQLEVDAALKIRFGPQLRELEEIYGAGSVAVERGMAIAYFVQQATSIESGGEDRADAREIADRLMAGESLETVLLGLRAAG